MKRRGRSFTAIMPPVRRLMLFAVIFAVSLQAYFVQTHIHGPLLGQPDASYSAAFKAPSAPLPADPLSPALCKLCQEVVHAGVAISPAGTAFSLLLEWVSVALPVPHLPASDPAPRTGWQGRAPPRR